MSIDRRMEKQLMVHPCDGASAGRRKDILTLATTWMAFEAITLGDISWSHKTVPCGSTYTRSLKESDS